MSIDEISPFVAIIISILSLIVSIAALRYKKKQFELAIEVFEEQKRKQTFSAKISDTYYHRAENNRRQLEYLGAILSLDNPSESSVFVRYFNVTLRFSVAHIRKLSFWQFLSWAKSKEAMRFTVPYPPDGSHSVSGKYDLASLPAVIEDRYPPQSWVFDRRTDELITFDAPVEIPKDTHTILWELVVYIPPELWKAAQQSNLTISKMDILLVLNDRRSQSLTARFEPRFGLAASSRERVTQLISQAKSLQKAS